MAHFGGIKPGVESIGAKLRIDLALLIDNGGDVHEQIWQMVFRTLAATRGEVVQTDDTVFQFLHAFADRLAVPAKFSFGAALSARTQLADGTGHKQPTGTALEGLRGDDEQ